MLHPQRYLAAVREQMEALDPAPGRAPPGRPTPISPPTRHALFGTPLSPPFPEGVAEAYFAMGCFWGAERLFWKLEGVYTTAVGYMGGETTNPSYSEVCSGTTGHTETVLVGYFPERVSYAELVAVFFEQHDPTSGPRQGNDIGMQYRSAIFPVDDEQTATALAMRDSYDEAIRRSLGAPITTEIAEGQTFYFAEPPHQQYLHKNPFGYCGLQANGVACPLPSPAATEASRKDILTG